MAKTHIITSGSRLFTPSVHSMKFSRIGQKFTKNIGILELMDDMGRALSGERPMLMLGGGNPAILPTMDAVWRESMQKLLNDHQQYSSMLGIYDPPRGNASFIHTLVSYYRRTCGWDITERNIALTPGSQSAFFYLFNMLGGTMDDGTFKKILLPLAPEYIGYVDQGIEQDIFLSCEPRIASIDDHTFKYHIDVDRLPLHENIGALCVSRPTNPTGNVLTDAEISILTEIATLKKIPLIIDAAYGNPFPRILFCDVAMPWNENIIYVQTLSKLGLPCARLGIVIAHEGIIKALESFNAIFTLANASLGQYMTQSLFENGTIDHLTSAVLQPFYRERAQKAIACVHASMNPRIPYSLHVCEGSMFLWLWCKDLPITCYELYERLKSRGVLVVPGCYFFPGIPAEWKHRNECIRINYSRDPAEVHRGIEIIADEIAHVYAHHSSPILCHQ